MSPETSQPVTAVSPIPRSLQFALFVTGLLWLLAAQSASEHAAQGIALRFNLSVIQSLLSQLFLVFLLLVGFTSLSWISTRNGGIRSINALPQRPTATREVQLGLALGWAMLLAAVLPMMLVGTLHPDFWLAPRSWLLAAIALTTLALNALALELAFRGYLYRRLIEAVGPVLATLLLSGIYALISSFRPNATSSSVAITFLLGLLLSLGYLRTHALWIGWGLHFAWNAAMTVLFGLPLAGVIAYTSLVDTNTNGPAWLTGGPYGPEAALLTAVVILGTMFFLHKFTRDYAWQYTHPPIVAAGYAMEVAPPKAHTDMEAAARPAPLVQIISTTPTAPSTMPVINDHLSKSTDKLD